MKNKITLLLALMLVLIVAIGCNLGSLTGSDEKPPKDSTGKSADSGSNDTKKPATPSGEIVEVGIPECDEVATFINDNSETIDDSYVAQALVLVYKNYVLEKIKSGVAEMTDEDKAEMAKVCKKTIDQLKKSVE